MVKNKFVSEVRNIMGQDNQNKSTGTDESQGQANHGQQDQGGKSQSAAAGQGQNQGGSFSPDAQGSQQSTGGGQGSFGGGSAGTQAGGSQAGTQTPSSESGYTGGNKPDTEKQSKDTGGGM
jgi:hypothetical protein